MILDVIDFRFCLGDWCITKGLDWLVGSLVVSDLTPPTALLRRGSFVGSKF